MTPAIVGIAQVTSAPTAAGLAARAIVEALRDANLRIEDVDGVVRFDREAAWEYDFPGLMRLRALDYYGAVPDAPGSGAALARLAAMAVSQELARVVVGYHARAEPRPVLPDDVLAASCGAGERIDRSPALAAGGAFVMRAAESPARVLGSMQAAIPTAARHLDAWLESRRDGVFRRAAQRLFDEAGIRATDVDVACLYSRPPGLVDLAIQDFGVTRGASRPRVNPHAGSPADVGLDGLDDLLEAVRQLRGQAANQVPGVRVALVAASPLEPTSAVLLGA